MQPSEEVADLYAAADVNVIPLQKGLVYAALPSKTADCLVAGNQSLLVLMMSLSLQNYVTIMEFATPGQTVPQY